LKKSRFGGTFFLCETHPNKENDIEYEKDIPDSGIPADRLPAYCTNRARYTHQ
jgi:hypothetical protein